MPSFRAMSGPVISRRGRSRLGGLIGLGLMLVSLTAFAQQQEAAPSLEELKALYRRPSGEPPAPRDNPRNPAAIALGQELFRDPVLSRSGNVACLSCHQPDDAWADRRAKPLADSGKAMSRRSPTLIEVGWQPTFLWDGRQDSLEEMVTGPISSPDIMSLPLDELASRLSNNPDYIGLFERAYPGEEVGVRTVSKALANFMRTIHAPRTRFDRWIEGEETLNAGEIEGFRLFNGKARCAVCHTGWRFTDDGFHDIGLSDAKDPGRGKVLPMIAVMAHAFKTPTLRGVADRPPYMHDGSLRDLDAVMRHYEVGGRKRPSLSPNMRPVSLSASERRNLIAFLKTLSGDARSARREDATPEKPQ